jgi:hypothetical protein
MVCSLLLIGYCSPTSFYHPLKILANLRQMPSSSRIPLAKAAILMVLSVSTLSVSACFQIPGWMTTILTHFFQVCERYRWISV